MRLSKEEAAVGVASTPAADHHRKPAVTVAPAGEAGKFQRLQERAGRAGHALMQTASGYMLVGRSGNSYHGECLDAVLHYLTCGEVA